MEPTSPTVSPGLPLLQLAQRFFAWWGAELAALIPASWRGAPPLQHLMREGVFCVDLKLPLAAERSLAAALRYQLMAQSPVPLDACIYDHRILNRDRQANEIDVRVVMTTLPRLAALNDQLHSDGARPELIGASMAGETYVFQRARRASRDAGARTRLWLGLSAALLLSILPLLHLTASSWASRLDAQMRALQQDIRPRVQVRSAAESLEAHGPVLSTRLREPPLMPMLHTIMAAHDKSDWAKSIDLSARKLTLTVHSSAPQELRTRLETQTALQGWRWRIVPPADLLDETAPTLMEATR